MTGLILPSIKTPEEHLVYHEGNIQAQKRNPNFNADKFLTNAKATYQRELERLGEKDILSLDAAARSVKMSPEDYRNLAERGQALLIRDNATGKEYVPDWSLTEGQINPLAVAVAKTYDAYKVTELTAVGFLGFMNQTSIFFDLSELEQHLRDKGAIKQSFALLAGWDGFKQGGNSGIVLTLENAVTLAKPGTDGYVYDTVLAAVNGHFNSGAAARSNRRVLGL